MKTKKLRPYIRRANGREKSQSMRIAFRLAFYQALGKPFFVMVQHGFPNLAIEVDATRRLLEKSPVMVRLGHQTFRQWAASLQKLATGG